MNVGEDKGRIVTDLIAEVKPQTMVRFWISVPVARELTRAQVELGGYIGYSCILFGDAVRKAGGKRYFSLERNPEFAAVIASLVDLAGLSEVVKVIVGSSDVSIKRLHYSGALQHIDLMFLDHYKPAYTTDLKLCEELKLVTPGSVMAADNVIKPGNPPYLEYVRSSVQEKRQALEKSEAGSGPDARFKDRTANQYAKRQGQEKLDASVKGNPNLVYESKLTNSFEPTGEPDGVEITRFARKPKHRSMLTGESSRVAHLAQNAALILLSFIFLPLTSTIVFLSYVSRPFLAAQAPANRRRTRSTHTPYFQPKTVLVTGVGMTKGLALARLFHEAGHNVIGADFGPLACGRVSAALQKYYGLTKPSGREGSTQYVHSLLDTIRREGVDLWVSCSGVASAVEDGEAKEAVERSTSCKAVQFDVATTTTLHEKHSFIEYTRSLGLRVPETHTVTSRTAVLDILQHAKGKEFVLKYIGMDDASRGDMTTLPRPTPADTRAFVSRLVISEDRPWILQQYIRGPEYCTHALVVNGQVKAFVACPSAELLMHYEALPADSPLSKAMLSFTRSFADAGGEGFTGHLSFDFLVDKWEAIGAKGGRPRLYPIECNPRAHTAVALFNGTPQMVEGYMSLLARREKGANGLGPDGLEVPRSAQKYYWVGHDLVALVLLPLLSFVLRQGTSLEGLTESVSTFASHLLFWKDGTFEVWDPLPCWWLYHVYWPAQFLAAIASGRKWSRVNVSTTKMFNC
ncbi:hypothetical protein LTR04_001464 [Oleoguttula sp. CCFEE 6159]|nr:hypothetical protein LTR04_001464 [Oleoguttula sp. CCFEE 6159]